ncbi:MAG: peptidylprolyl isomerase [Actinobacteria bacterium]|nr:peptidylprolyl isomerase [Actinomycetota bacterium]
MRKSALALAGLLLTATLAGCAPVSDLACEELTTGDQVKAVSVSGNFGEIPTVTFPSPLTSESVQSAVIVKGDGPVFTGRNLVEFEFAGYNGGTGELIQQSQFDGGQAATAFFGPSQVPNFCAALAGAREGSRVVAVIPPADAHGGEGIPSLGVGPTDGVVFVFDLRKVFLEKATGSTVAPEAGFPAVVKTSDGVPGITIPNTAAPTELKIAQLIRGDGAPVKKGQLVTMHYSGFLWDGAEQFDSSWGKGQPAQFQMQDGGLIDGFLQAVVGQPVGSQVIAIIPPQLGYGEAGSGSIPPNATLVFVIDILGTSD